MIFLSIDDNEVDNLRKLCNEVFGESNFVAQISYINNPKGRSHDLFFATCHEYLLIYTKSQLSKGAFSLSKDVEELQSDYTFADENGAYRLIELRNTHREFGKHNRPNLFYPFYVTKDGIISVAPIVEHTHEIYPIWSDGFEGCWTWSSSKAFDDISLLIAKKVDNAWKIYRKSYALQDGEASKKQLKSLWTDKDFFTERGQKVFNELFESKEKIFQSPKSVDLIKLLIRTCTSFSDIVLDFFSGSATTAHAVLQLNADDSLKRKYILVQTSEDICDEKSEAAKAGYANICEIGKERIRRAGRKIKEEAGLLAQDLDIGFRVLKIDSSNMKDVYYTPEEYAQMQFNLDGFADNIKEDRTGEDLLFQVMLDLGIPLSAKIKQDGEVWYVNEDYLIACFSRVDTELITEIAKRKPYYAVFRDSSFASDSAMVNFEQVFSTYSPNTIRKVL